MSLLQYQLWLFAPIIVLCTLFVALCVYVYYTSDKNLLARWVIGPVLIVAAFFSFTIIGQHLGYAYPSKLPEKFVYLGHTVVLSADSSTKEWIDIMILSRKPWSQASRLQRIPWSKQMEQAVNNAQQIHRQGGTAIMERGTRGSDGGSPPNTDEYPYSARRVVPSEVTPKSPIPEQSAPNRNPDSAPSSEPDTRQFKT
jgi:hypothetical protein